MYVADVTGGETCVGYVNFARIRAVYGDVAGCTLSGTGLRGDVAGERRKIQVATEFIDVDVSGYGPGFDLALQRRACAIRRERTDVDITI